MSNPKKTSSGTDKSSRPVINNLEQAIERMEEIYMHFHLFIYTLV